MTLSAAIFAFGPGGSIRTDPNPPIRISFPLRRAILPEWRCYVHGACRCETTLVRCPTIVYHSATWTVAPPRLRPKTHLQVLSPTRPARPSIPSLPGHESGRRSDSLPLLRPLSAFYLPASEYQVPSTKWRSTAFIAEPHLELGTSRTSARRPRSAAPARTSVRPPHGSAGWVRRDARPGRAPGDSAFRVPLPGVAHPAQAPCGCNHLIPLNRLRSMGLDGGRWRLEALARQI